ncbi:hypothetical protein QTP86_013837 [Hemibagrus guttatus]|nr:hypothetical protein QTP86_013837 [Hemibagrus guttatus]
MGKREDLSEFDKGQIVMARRLDQSISKTAALVGCSRSAVVSIYQKYPLSPSECVVSDFSATRCKLVSTCWSCLAALAPVRKSFSPSDAVPASTGLCVHHVLASQGKCVTGMVPAWTVNQGMAHVCVSTGHVCDCVYFQEGYTGFACQKCSNEKTYGERCSSGSAIFLYFNEKYITFALVCDCVHGECNSGPDGDGQCYCQPPYSGPKCDQVTSSCSDCSPYSYCKGEGASAKCECLPSFSKVGLFCVVHNIIQRFRESGTISVRKGQGRKTILDARDLRALRRHCITYRNATVMEITTWAQEYFQKTLSVNTIHRAIRRCRLKLYSSKKKPYLNMIQKHRCFLWAKAHLKWTVAKWKTVLWSDESKFEVLFGKLGRHVIRTKEDKDNPSCYQRSVQKPASLMVWGCMSACGMGSLHIWKGTINAERCVCNAGQISDGWRCYGDIMERVLELDREGSQAGNLTGSIALFERGCNLILSKHGPFTAFIPMDTSQISIGKLNQARGAEAICKHHLILGQRLYKDLEGQDLWTYGGELMRFKPNKKFISKSDPDTLFTIIQSDIPASNGIIHIVDKVFTFSTVDTYDSAEFSSKTIGDILAEDARFNRFVSLLDNCGAPMPLQGPGPLTLFVPTNKAVDRSRDGSIIYMLNNAKHKLQELLRHHMFSQAAVTVDQLASMTEIQSMANQVITINVTGDGRVLLTEKGILLDVKDIVASNGIIHMIDGLLVPPSIVPIMPNRCDVNETTIIMSPCVMCKFISESQCPPGSEEQVYYMLWKRYSASITNVLYYIVVQHLSIFCIYQHLIPQTGQFHNCDPLPDPRWSEFVSVRGCAKYCKAKRTRAECCKGFFGLNCKPCIGGFQHPCYDKGSCSDGIYGDGSCKCHPGFMGIGCHICSNPKKHGENCDEGKNIVAPVEIGLLLVEEVEEGGECVDRERIGKVGCELEEKERFWSELDEVIESIPTGERVVIGADFNGHVGEGNRGDEEVMGKFGVKERNLEGRMVVDFAKGMDMAVVNTYFQKREEHRVTYKSGGRRTQVDYIPCRRGNLKEISDCKVVVGESVARQHRMVVCRMTLMVCKKKRSEIEKKTKWWKLKKEECCEEFRQKLRQALGGQVVLPDDWETTAEVIRVTGRKVLGVSSGRRKEDKETWWWNEEVQDSIQRKRLAKKKWNMDRTEENRQEYKELQRRVKREVSKTKQEAYDELYTRLDTREGQKDLYRLARQRDRDGKDVQQVRVIKNRDGRVLTSEESVQRRWKEYFEELMNEENEREKRVEVVNSVEQKVDKIRKDEVRKALKRMKSGKAVGPDNILVEVWKCLGEAAVEFLTSLFNKVLESGKMPEEWRRSVLVPIFKNKGDVQSCSNYRVIKLMSHTMKLWERVVEARLRKVVEICEQQYGFMPRKSTTDAIFALRILMKERDLEKAYDRVPREELWYCMRKSGVAEKYVRVVQDMYERSRTVVRCAVGQTEEFKVVVGLHQGSALSPFLFAIVMDQLSEEVRQESPCTMMFADGIVICSESREQVEENLERWRFALERRGMKVSRNCRCVHGVCDNRPGSQGVCRRNSCLSGYTGEFCDLTATLCDSDGASEHCHVHAYCTRTDGLNTCVCNPGYDGDGYACTEANLCLKPDRGGCHINAQCVYAGPGNVSCVCNEGWTGDGVVCVEINNCLTENRGGCHKQAECTYTGPGQSECACKKGFTGDGIMCQIVNPCLTDNGGCHYMELEGNSDFYTFNRYLQRHPVISAGSNVTALVPSQTAFKNLTDSEQLFWTDFYRLPYLLQAHFLDGIYTYDDLRKQVNKTVQTKSKTKWEITIKNGELMIDNAEILVPDLQATNGFIHIINTVLKPPISDIPPPPPDLMEVLNKTPSFSLFREAALLYNLTESIRTRDFTVFVPSDSAVKEYLEKTNSTRLDENTVKYHVIIKEQLFPEHLTDGTLKNTLLGNEYQIMVHLNSENKTLINDVALDGNFTEIKRGVIISISRVLVIHKNYCSKDIFMKSFGRCGACNSAPKCTFDSQPVKDAFPLNMKPNCKYRTKVGKRRKSVQGCMIDCIRKIKDHSCCPGYFGRDCFKCPGKVDNWCSNNGKCQDGLWGNGECLCNEGFHGTACEMCEPGRYGKDCKSDLGKAYDRVPREELWYCMRKSGVAEKYIRVVQDMYERSRTVVRCAVGQTEEFKVEVGMHQGSTLSPFLFAIVMDQLSEEVRQESHWTMMFADDIVICSESREQVEENLERWRFALERRGMKVSRSKTEYMCVNEREGSGTVRLQGEEVKKVQEFKYLGSTVQSNGECGKEVKKRVQAECYCEHGKCLDGIDGNGRCICYKGWKGVNCSVEIVNDECGGICDQNANCFSPSSGVKPACVCAAGYRGNGTFCQETDLCAVNNGGCSEHAICTKISPGERSCTCKKDYTGDGTVCLEMDPCLVNNGGCSENTDCIKTGPNTAACVCKSGYASKRNFCLPINLCLKDNGGCSPNAMCQYLGPGERNCTCRYGYKGNGIECMGTVSRELLHKQAANWFRRNLAQSRVRDLYSRGPFTVFVPHTDHIENYSIALWEFKKRVPDLLRYHIVGCEEVSESQLKSITRLVAASGHVLNFSVRDGAVYINGDTKIVHSDYECSNGVIHFIDKVLIPYELKNESKAVEDNWNVTNAAEAYGYTMFSKLLQKANLMDMVEHKAFQPFTMFWPTDKAFNSLPQEQKNWLYSEDHLDKLQAFLKFHIIRDQRVIAIALPTEKTVRSMYGAMLTFSCSQDLTGDILINGNDAKIVERHLEFYSGMAHGIDKVLEPPNIGAHCDDFSAIEIKGRCGSCLFPPFCPYGTVYTNKTNVCSRPWSPYRRHYFYDDFDLPGPYNFKPFGCNRMCSKMSWVSKCCKNHYGRNCQVCPGGLESPCGEHGDCDDGRFGTGTCKCHKGFNGTACELCEKNHYGSNCTACTCTSNGKCDDGIDGDGSCFCQEGWTGLMCESKIGEKPVCSPECHSKAVCLPENQCQCEPPYEGNGYNCTAPDLCSEYNGGCHEQADCTQSEINVRCTCKSGYNGDGNDCSPINPCVEQTNGGCSDFANCIFIGPNERRCECLQGYVGNGVQCFEKVVPPVDRCLENNGDCHAKAICKDLHFHTKTAGVFHMRSPAGKYMMNYSTAEEACKAEGATLATLNQLSDAQQMGMHLCVAGWIDGKKVGYPIRFPSVKCGDNQVGVIQYNDPVVSAPYDAYCYRIRDVTCECGPGYVGDGEFCSGNLASVLATHSNFSIFYSLLVKYSETAEEGKKLLDFLSTSSSNITLFVPHNAGFSANETPSLRDMEYHVSSNNSLHYYEDLKHNTAIPSWLGYNLKVIIATDNQSQAEVMPNCLWKISMYQELHKMGLYGLAAAHKPKITMCNAKRWLEWCKGNVFSRVIIGQFDGQIWVCQMPREHYLQACKVAKDPPPVKLVNKRTILIWDIPASNGLIHIIDGPIKAPPVVVSVHIFSFKMSLGPAIPIFSLCTVTPPTPSTVHSKSSAPTVTAILIVICIGGVIAGVAYYFLKHKNDAFSFQYFKASEGEQCESPASVEANTPNLLD